MNQGLRRLLTLVVVFVAAFALVFLLRNGLDGWRLLFGGRSGPHRPERFTLADKAPLDLSEVDLLARLNDEYAAVTDAVAPSVVSIDTTGLSAQRMLDGFGRRLVRSVPTQDQGSGVIVSEEGHVLTNQHVVRNQQEIRVTLHDGRMFPATLIGEDPLLDIAVLRIEGDGPFQPLKFGDSSEVRRGQIVFAFGNPFGLGETVTQGIISAVERSISDTQRDLFQTDAAINPGNSGGPLVNLRGELIGINSAIFRPDERVRSGFQGVGFSIPSNDVKEALLGILERGRPIRGYLGVRMGADPRIKELVGYQGDGAVILGVSKGSPAEQAGLRPEDVVVRYDGEAIESLPQLIALVQRTRVGREVEIEAWRDGKIFTARTKIVESKPGAESTLTPKLPEGRTAAEVVAAAGLEVRDLDPASLAAGLQGARISDVRAATVADGELVAGDLVIGVNQTPVANAGEFEFLFASVATQEPTTVHVVRGAESLAVTLPTVDLPDP